PPACVLHAEPATAQCDLACSQVAALEASPPAESSYSCCARPHERITNPTAGRTERPDKELRQLLGERSFVLVAEFITHAATPYVAVNDIARVGLFGGRVTLGGHDVTVPVASRATSYSAAVLRVMGWVASRLVLRRMPQCQGITPRQFTTACGA